MDNKSGKSNDNLWLLGFLIVSTVLIWHWQKDNIISLVIIVKYWQTKAIYLMTGLLEQELEILKEARFYKLEFYGLAVLANQVSFYTALPLFVIILGLAYITYKYGGSKYSKIYSMLSLAKAEQGNWPQIKPTLKLNLVKQDINKGPWAMAQSPLEFGRANNILIAPKKGQVSATLDKAKAAMVFAKQLGPKWTGTDALDIYTKVLLAAFIARINRDRKTASNILKALPSCKFNNINEEVPLVQYSIDKYIDSPLVKAVLNRHHYEYTIMIGLLETARNDGVLASADFLWLKPVKRTLWYVLNCVGRQTPFIEVAGIYSHYLTEKGLKMPLAIAQVENAVDAFEFALTELIYEDK